jgi:hypothetical protein
MNPQFHKLSTGCGSGVVAGVNRESLIPMGPFRLAPSTRIEWTFDESHLYPAGWAVTLLGDNDLGDTVQFGLVGLVNLITPTNLIR